MQTLWNFQSLCFVAFLSNFGSDYWPFLGRSTVKLNRVSRRQRKGSDQRKNIDTETQCPLETLGTRNSSSRLEIFDYHDDECVPELAWDAGDGLGGGGRIHPPSSPRTTVSTAMWLSFCLSLPLRKISEHQLFFQSCSSSTCINVESSLAGCFWISMIPETFLQELGFFHPSPSFLLSSSKNSVFFPYFISFRKNWPEHMSKSSPDRWYYFLPHIQQVFMPDSECHVLCRYCVYKDEVTDFKEDTV